METLKEIKTYICDMLVYCDVISSKDSSTQSKIGFARLMGKVAKGIADKCDKLELELEMKPIYTLNYNSFEVRTEKRQLYRSKHRRHRQIGRLLYYYCCVRYLTKVNGRWVKAMSDGKWLGEI